MTKNDHEDLQKYSTELFSFKELLKEYQKIQDQERIDLTNHNQKVDSLKLDLLELRYDLGAKATVAQVLNLEEEIKKNKNDAYSIISDFKARFQAEINEKVENNLKTLSNWSNEHEEMVKGNLEKLQSILFMCAKASEMNALEEDVKVNFHQLRKRIKIAENSLTETRRLIVEMKRNESCILLNKWHVALKRRLIKRAWKKWCTIWQKESNRITTEKANAKIMKKVLSRCMKLVKRRAFAIWDGYVLYDQQLQLKREKASRVLRRWIETKDTNHVNDAFKKWRWMMTMKKVSLPRASIVSAKKEELHKESAPTVEQQPIMSPIKTRAEQVVKRTTSNKKRKSYDSEAIVKSFGNDMKNIQIFLAQELNKIRNYDIVQSHENLVEKIEDLRSDTIAENTNLMNRIESDVKDMEARMDKNYDYFENEILNIRKTLSKQERSLDNTAHRIRTFEEYHGKKIEALFDQNQRIEERLLNVEKLLTRTEDKISNISQNQSTNVNIIEDLTQKQSLFSREINKMHQEFSSSIRNTHETFTATTKELKFNEENLSQTLYTSINDMENFQTSTRTSIGEINTILSTAGVRKPSLDAMVNLCLKYEKIAHDKTYVVAMNYSFPYYTDDDYKVVSKGGGHKKIIMDIPESIAAFAYEYAAWIAYQADHEVLIRIVDGSTINGEDILYADDDTTKRRKSLLHCLKEEMSMELEEIHPEPGALRLEARRMYLARLIDATDSALSKHDQVLVSAQTRIGRIKATTAVCVACDRPMRGKARKGKIGNVPSKQEDGVANKKMKTAAAISLCGLPENSDLYVKKCGFKMPLKPKCQNDIKVENR